MSKIMFRLIPVFAVFVLIGCGNPLKNANLHFEMGNYEEAARAADAVIVGSPKNVEAYLLKGKALMYAEQYVDAERAFGQAVALNEGVSSDVDNIYVEFMVSKWTEYAMSETPEWGRWETMPGRSSSGGVNDDWKVFRPIREASLEARSQALSAAVDVLIENRLIYKEAEKYSGKSFEWRSPLYRLSVIFAAASLSDSSNVGNFVVATARRFAEAADAENELYAEVALNILNTWERGYPAPNWFSGWVESADSAETQSILNLIDAKGLGTTNKSRKTLRLAATIAQAAFMYSIDNNQFPEACSLQDLKKKLSPYNQEILETDGWGNPLRIASSASYLVVMSPGADKEYEIPFECGGDVEQLLMHYWEPEKKIEKWRREADMVYVASQGGLLNRRGFSGFVSWQPFEYSWGDWAFDMPEKLGYGTVEFLGRDNDPQWRTRRTRSR